MKRYLNYANVMSTLAVFGVLAGGSAYAVNTIGSKDIKPRAVTGKHLKAGAVKGKHVRERTLDARRFSAIGGAQAQECDPVDASFVDCVAVAIRMPAPGRAMVVASAGAYSAGAEGASGRCEVRIDGAPQPLGQFPGEVEGNSSSQSTDGFARTLVSPQLPAGQAEFALSCNQPGSADLRIADPTIAAIALTHGRR